MPAVSVIGPNMPGTIAEQIIARAAGRESVSPGDHVFCDVDVALTNDGLGAVAHVLEEQGIDRVWDPDRIVGVMDHVAPSHNIEDANEKGYVREFVDRHRIRNFYDVGTGIAHEVMPEQGHVRPGELVVGTDSHTVTYGAFGTASTGIGTTDMAYVFATGQTWFRVPHTINFHVTGDWPAYTSAKDLLLTIAGEYGTDVARYRAIEYDGPAIEALPLDERMVLSNMAIELGGKFGFTPVDDTVTDYVDDRTDEPYTPVRANGADYKTTYDLDVSNLRPKVAKPHRVENVVDVDEVTGIDLDQVFIGSCTHGKYEDLRRAARILEGHTVDPRTRVVITPASREIFTRASRDGLVEIFHDAGAVVTNSTCGACIGYALGVLGDDEVCLSAMNRNFKGRMGSPTAEIYLSSPETAAASAITGRITDPAEVA